MVTTLALDPGQTTGWSLWNHTPETPLTLVEYGQVGDGVRGFSRWAYGMLARYSYDWIDEVVSESFVDDHRTANPDVTPLRIEGAIEALFTSAGITTFYQRNTAKAKAPDALLKEHGWYFPGKPHACDSARHAVASMSLRRHMPTMRLLWPPH